MLGDSSSVTEAHIFFIYHGSTMEVETELKAAIELWDHFLSTKIFFYRLEKDWNFYFL